MAAIGSETFLTMRGVNDPAQYVIEDITAPGVFGVALKITGFRGEPFVVETMTGLTNMAQQKTRLLAYKAMQSGIYTITDGAGNTWQNILVRRVWCTEAQAAMASTGSHGAYMRCGWELQDISSVYV